MKTRNIFIIAIISGLMLFSFNSFAQDSCGGKKESCCSGKAEDTKVTEAAWNAVCPVMGGKIDPEASKVKHNGKVYGFCCNGCDKKFKKDPAKYSANLSDDGKTFVGKKERH